MRIGIDARAILNPEKNPAIGVGHYTYQLIRHLLKTDQRNHYVIFFDYKVREKDVKKFLRPNVTIKYFPWSDYKKYLPGAYSEILGMATLSGKRLDVLHAVSPDGRVPMGYRGKVVATFQDLSVFKYPEYFHQDWQLRARYNRRYMAGRANKLIAVSENTKKDLRELFGIADEKISVIRNAMDERFTQPLIVSPEKLREQLKEKFRIERNYLLFVGTLEPIKNITRLIKAFSHLKNKTRAAGGHFDYQLVLAGKRTDMAKEFLQNAKDEGVAEDVLFLGYVEGDDLRMLLSGANIFLMPSLYEGFGMSVLEAMAVGAPCLVSDIEALREVAGEAAAYCNPLNEEEMADELEKLLQDKERRESLVIAGRERAAGFSWDRCAEETLNIYQEVAGQ